MPEAHTGSGIEAGCAPLVSVIIPVYNAESTLGLCLEAVARSAYAPIEVIVVCDGCTDRTADVARRAGARTLAIEMQRGAAYTRNLGASVASGEIFFFVDSDCILRPDAISHAVEAIRGGEHVVFGCYTPETRTPGFFTRFKNYQHHYVHQTGAEYQSSFWTGCGAVTRHAFEKVDGFDVGVFSCEDIEFGHALAKKGFRIRLVKSMQAEHLKRYDLKRLIVSDLFYRAVPWTRLAAAGRSEFGKLNTSKKGVASVALAVSALALAAAAPFYSLAGWGAVAALLATAALNRGLLGLLVSRRGVLFGFGGFFTLLLHFLICAAGFLIGRLSPPFPRRRTPAPSYAYSEFAARATNSRAASA